MSSKFSDRVRGIFRSMTVSVCGCHKNKDVLVAMETENMPYSKTLVADENNKHQWMNISKNVEEDILQTDKSSVDIHGDIYEHKEDDILHKDADDNGDDLDIVHNNLSADEKLRSFGHKSHNSSKNTTNTYCGVQNGQREATKGFFVAQTRTEAPEVPPPPLPLITTNEIQHKRSHDIQPHFEQANQNRHSIHAAPDTIGLEIPPRLYPKPESSNMAERRQRRNRNSGTSDENVGLKKRSRSEGPHGRRRIRNSMQETPNKNSEYKQTSNGRHSMYTGHLSDDNDIHALNSGSDSPDTDEQQQQQWTKNPLMVRKSRKSDRTSKTDKRRSMHNVENRKSAIEQVGPKSNQHGREFGDNVRKFDHSPGGNHKAKFQRMEENRKKRIDIAVTSDEECSPQLRISRLRQRAMLSSQNMDSKYGQDGSLNIVPVRGESSFQAFRDLQNGNSQGKKNEQNRVSQYDENRHSKYDENFNIDNMNGNFYQEYTKQQGVRHNKLPSVLPEFLPENRRQLNAPPTVNQYANKGSHVTRNVTNQNQAPSVQIRQKSQQGVAVSNESPKLRSFNEVKANQPTQLKQANQKIELTQRSPDSSSDSLDDLIESNIQYLESEIESGKLKRQSGNYTKSAPEKVVQRQVVREPLRPQPAIPVQTEIRSRLNDPRSYVSNKLTSTVTTVQPKVVHKSAMCPQPYHSYAGSNSVPTPRNQPSTTAEPRNIQISGSQTYSPYMQRKTYEVNEDLSKSDSHLDAMNSSFAQSQNAFQATKNYVPYPVLNKQTGNVIYVQRTDYLPEQIQSSDTKPTVDSGMFSDVEYDIEVSERIKKWEKKLTPGELEEREKRKVLNTIKEYESFSDSNQKDSVPDTPVEVRRELWQLLSPTNNSGVGKLSVNLTKSTSSMSDSNTQDSYYEPKVVSSETNLHRIFRVVNEPRPKRVVNRAPDVFKPSANSEAITVQTRRKNPAEVANYTQSLSNVTLSESEIGSNMQQSWPPMAVDSDSGIRKSWRMSRYEEEINELKELVSDNVRDIRKKFDSDMSETDTKRASSPVTRSQRTTSPVFQTVPSVPQTTTGTSKLTLNIHPVTPTNPRSPVTIRRKFIAEQPGQNVQPVTSTNQPIQSFTPNLERKLPVYRNIPVETKSVSNMQAVAPPLQTTITEIKPPLTSEPCKVYDSKMATEPKVSAPDVWSPNLESRKGLVSMERVKARTLQTIPFSEDPVWKEIEGLATFDKHEGISKEVNFDEIDELLKIATGGVDNLKNRTSKNTDNQMTRMSISDVFMTPSPSEARSLMTQSYNPSVQGHFHDKQRAFLDSTSPGALPSKHVFNPPTIQPLKLNSKPAKKSSTSALDEVLEDIRASLQKKPLSPKLMKNIDTSESNSSTNISLQSPLTKSLKAFHFPQEVKKAHPEVPAKPAKEVVRSSSATPGYDNTQSSWKPAQHGVMPQVMQQIANAPYIDPEFTQFPYIINGNYHLDPNLLTEKLKSTGLAHESSDDQTTNQIKAALTVPANHQSMNGFHEAQPTNWIHQSKLANQSKSVTHELDQSVNDLRSLAQEVEYKLSQIKSRIITADEARLDNILLALRKFAPMTEQTFFNVKFTPNFESERIRRSKLQDALAELDKMYESLDLEDKSLLDRASRREETLGYGSSNLQRRNSEKNTSSTQHFKYERSNSVELGRDASNAPGNESGILRRSQIDEIEKQTQNEFEDITKSFQVLLDEVTKQCRSVAQGSSRYSASDSNMFSPTSTMPQFSSQRPADEIRQEPPRQQLKIETQSQRAVQDSYNTAIKELESVAMGTTQSSGESRSGQGQPVQSVLYLNLDKSKPEWNQIKKTVSPVSPTRNIDIQVQSKAVASNKYKPIVTTAAGSSQFVSMATEFHQKPVLATSVVKDSSVSDAKGELNKNAVTLQVELNLAKSQGQTEGQSRGRGGERFRKRGNIEHRKSMPAITRTVETQTVETQTESSLTVAEMKAKYEQIRKSSLQEVSSDSSPDVKVRQKTSDIKADDSSSDDEKYTKSRMRRSLSCPDIVALLEEFDRKEKEKEKRKANAKEKISPQIGLKSSSPKSVKQRHENKSRFRSLQNKDESLSKQGEMSTSVTSDEMEAPVSKPPVYPVWKYPGQVDAPVSKKTDLKRYVDREFQKTVSDTREFNKTVSDTEQGRVVRGISRSVSDTEQRTVAIGTVDSHTGATVVTETVVRRRTRSFGYEHEEEERPKSFHELVSTFEQNPQRLEKIRQIGLRKCVSEDSMFTDLILQKIYTSETDMTQDERKSRLSGSEWLKLPPEMKLKD